MIEPKTNTTNQISPEESPIVANQVDQTYDGLQKQIEQLNGIMGYLVIALFIGFVLLLTTVCTLVITYYHDSRISYDSLITKVDQINQKP